MKKLLGFVAVIVAFIIITYIGNTTIAVTQQEIRLAELPQELEGLRVVQVSDLHDAAFGEEQQDLIAKVAEQEPDLIFVTGDVVDSNRYNLEQSLQAVEGFVELAPVYYVTGNHEIATGKVDEIKSSLSQLGVTVLSNEVETLPIEGQTIEVFGIDDPLNGIPIADALAKHPRTDLPRLTLSHRPEVFEEYVRSEQSLVFSGHAHGGQIRIPGLGGLIAPGQGFFPQYTAGVYEEGETQMVVSRGLGNSLFPVRIFNRPEVVTVILSP